MIELNKQNQYEQISPTYSSKEAKSHGSQTSGEAETRRPTDLSRGSYRACRYPTASLRHISRKERVGHRHKLVARLSAIYYRVAMVRHRTQGKGNNFLPSSMVNSANRDYFRCRKIRRKLVAAATYGRRN